MEPLPETRVALEHLLQWGDTGISAELSRIGREVREEVPETVGVSLALLQDGLTFTLVSDSEVAGGLDAVQYLDAGPCIAAMIDGEVVDTNVSDLLEERHWHLFAQAQAALGVRSTLSLPILGGQDVVAGVNLYASTVDAFDGKHARLARICRAWAPGVVTNADLSFLTREEARATPDRLRSQEQFDLATGMLAQLQSISVDDAADRMREAARRAGVTELQVARTLLHVLHSGDDPV